MIEFTSPPAAHHCPIRLRFIAKALRAIHTIVVDSISDSITNETAGLVAVSYADQAEWEKIAEDSYAA